MSPPPEIIGRYRVVRSLGEGGMGSVYVAHDPDVDRLVAIKLIYHARGSDLGQLRERFKREARSIGSLRHVNIVTLYEFGSHEGEPFLAMEYVEGQTLGSLIKSQPPVALTRRIQIIEHVAAGLHHAHSQGIVHRDIKPANVMVSSAGIVKVLDFGIARPISASPVTVTGNVIGTLNYMSPEQLQGQHIDARSDVFSLGAVLYEAVTGELAFPGDIQTGVITRILSGHPEPILRSCPDAPGSLVDVIDRMLAKDPNQRPADMEAVRLALVAARADMGDSSIDEQILPDTRGRRAVVSASHLETELLREWPDVVDNAAEPLAPTVLSDPKPRRSNSWRARTALISLGVSLVAGLAWLGWPYLRSGAPPPATPPVTATTVAIDILPWATIEAIVRKSDGKNVAPANFVTPDLVSLPPGVYAVRATNPDYEPLEFEFTVTTSPYLDIRKQLKGFDADAAAKQGLGRRPGL